jgi:hypothetical protein
MDIHLCALETLFKIDNGHTLTQTTASVMKKHCFTNDLSKITRFLSYGSIPNKITFSNGNMRGLSLGTTSKSQKQDLLL